MCNWSAQEIDFVDWVFNSSAVLRERASLMEQHEGLTYERDAVSREPFALRSSYFVDELTDDLSIEMVKRIQNRYGVEVWPWERAGFFGLVVGAGLLYTGIAGEGAASTGETALKAAAYSLGASIATRYVMGRSSLVIG